MPARPSRPPTADRYDTTGTGRRHRRAASRRPGPGAGRVGHPRPGHRGPLAGGFLPAALPGGAPFFLGHIRRGAAAFAVHECLLPWAREHLTKLEPEWCLDYACLKQMDDALRPWGWTVANAHPFFAPDPTCPRPAWNFPQSGLNRRSWSGSGGRPVDGRPGLPARLPGHAGRGRPGRRGQPVGMAGASRDGERLWQVGVNVLPPHRGRGLAAGLTALLKDELLRRGSSPSTAPPRAISSL